MMVRPIDAYRLTTGPTGNGAERSSLGGRSVAAKRGGKGRAASLAGIVATVAVILPVGSALAGAATASADGLTCQTGCVIDRNGTQRDYWDYDGTNGTGRALTSQPTGGHSIVSDACFVQGDGCQPGGYDPRTIAASSGSADDPDSALDGDGIQAAATRGPRLVAVPGTKASPGTPATSTGGFYYPH